MRSICHNCDRVRNVATDHFNDHKDEADEDNTAQLALRFFGILKLLKELLVLFNMHSMKLAHPAKATLASAATWAHLIVTRLLAFVHSFKLLTQKN